MVVVLHVNDVVLRLGDRRISAGGAAILALRVVPHDYLVIRETRDDPSHVYVAAGDQAG